mgnify:CR=1 FL=1
MNFNLSPSPSTYAAQEGDKSTTLHNVYKPRTLREQIQDRIAGHNAQIVSLQEALDALTPDVEKALNALQKIS